MLPRGSLRAPSCVSCPSPCLQPSTALAPLMLSPGRRWRPACLRAAFTSQTATQGRPRQVGCVVGTGVNVGEGMRKGVGIGVKEWMVEQHGHTMCNAGAGAPPPTTITPLSSQAFTGLPTPQVPKLPQASPRPRGSGHPCPMSLHLSPLPFNHNPGPAQAAQRPTAAEHPHLECPRIRTWVWCPGRSWRARWTACLVGGWWWWGGCRARVCVCVRMHVPVCVCVSKCTYGSLDGGACRGAQDLPRCAIRGPRGKLSMSWVGVHERALGSLLAIKVWMGGSMAGSDGCCWQCGWSRHGKCKGAALPPLPLLSHQHLHPPLLSTPDSLGVASEEQEMLKPAREVDCGLFPHQLVSRGLCSVAVQPDTCTLKWWS